MPYRILHWLPVLPCSLDDRAIHNPDRAIDGLIEPRGDVLPKQFDTQQAQPLLAVAQPFEQGDI